MQCMDDLAKINKVKFGFEAILPDEGEIHGGKNRAEQSADCVGLVEEVECHVLDSSLVHRLKRLHTARELSRRRRVHTVLRFRATTSCFSHCSM